MGEKQLQYVSASAKLGRVIRNVSSRSPASDRRPHLTAAEEKAARAARKAARALKAAEAGKGTRKVQTAAQRAASLRNLAKARLP